MIVKPNDTLQSRDPQRQRTRQERTKSSSQLVETRTATHLAGLKRLKSWEIDCQSLEMVDSRGGTRCGRLSCLRINRILSMLKGNASSKYTIVRDPNVYPPA